MIAMEKKELQILMVQQKVTMIVTPAEAGVYNLLKILDSGFRRNDGKMKRMTFYEFVKI